MGIQNKVHKTLEKSNFQQQTFNRAIKGNQNLPIKQITSNSMTGKQIPFSYHSRSNSEGNRDTSRNRTRKRISEPNIKPYCGNSIFKLTCKAGSSYRRPQNVQTEKKINYKNNKSPSISRAQSPFYNREGNR